MRPYFMRFKNKTSILFFIFHWYLLCYHSLIQAYMIYDALLPLDALQFKHATTFISRQWHLSNALSMIAPLQNILTSSRLLHVICEHPVVKGSRKTYNTVKRKHLAYLKNVPDQTDLLGQNADKKIIALSGLCNFCLLT